MFQGRFFYHTDVKMVAISYNFVDFVAFDIHELTACNRTGKKLLFPGKYIFPGDCWDRVQQFIPDNTGGGSTVELLFVN